MMQGNLFKDCISININALFALFYFAVHDMEINMHYSLTIIFHDAIMKYMDEIYRIIFPVVEHDIIHNFYLIRGC